MTITIQIPTALRRHTSGTGRTTCAATNLDELFTALDQQFPELKPHLRDEAGQVRRFLNVYVNEEDIRFLGGNNYAFQDGDEVFHKSARHQRMTVLGYTSDGKVICRWKEKTGFRSEQFFEAELEKWVDTPACSTGPMEGHGIDKYQW